METARKLQMINEIKQIERELYLKRSQLASDEAMEYDTGKYQKLDPKEWREVFSKLIEQIGLLSVGGDSVEEIRKERQR